MTEHDELVFDARVALPEAQERFRRAEADVERLRRQVDRLSRFCDTKEQTIRDLSEQLSAAREALTAEDPKYGRTPPD